MQFDFAEAVRRGRKPAEVPADVAAAVAILIADDEHTLPLSWRKNRNRRTYMLRDGRRVVLWVRKGVANYKPGTEWTPCRERAGVFLPSENAK